MLSEHGGDGAGLECREVRPLPDPSSPMLNHSQSIYPLLDLCCQAGVRGGGAPNPGLAAGVAGIRGPQAGSCLESGRMGREAPRKPGPCREMPLELSP